MQAAVTPRRFFTNSGKSLGILEAVLSGVGFGFLGLFGKGAFRAGLTAGENLALRFLLSAALLWIWVLATRPREALLPRRTLLACLGLGLGGYAVFSSFYFQALKGLSASLTVLLLYTFPGIVALGAWALFKEKPSRRKLLSLPVIMVGLGLLVWGDIAVNDGASLLFGVGAAVLYSLYILVSSRLLNGVDPIISVTYIQSAAGVGLGLLHLRDPARTLHLVQTAWPLILGMALVSTVVPMVLFLRSLQRLTSAEVSMLSTTEPITGVLLAALFLGERLSVVQILGGAGIIAALIYMARGEEQNKSL